MADAVKCRIKVESTGKSLLIPISRASTVADLLQEVCKRAKVQLSDDLELVDNHGCELFRGDQIGDVVEEGAVLTFKNNSSQGIHLF